MTLEEKFPCINNITTKLMQNDIIFTFSRLKLSRVLFLFFQNLTEVGNSLSAGTTLNVFTNIIANFPGKHTQRSISFVNLLLKNQQYYKNYTPLDGCF